MVSEEQKAMIEKGSEAAERLFSGMTVKGVFPTKAAALASAAWQCSQLATCAPATVSRDVDKPWAVLE